LHSGDRVFSINGNSVRTWGELRQILGRARIGDVVHLVVQGRREREPRTVSITVTGYDRPVVAITETTDATEKQKRLREAWIAGSP
jgi:PDZ domain-containing secreted protein